MRKIFIPPELYDWIECMDNDMKGRLFDLIYRYNLWLDYEIDNDIKFAFNFFKPFFDKDIEKHEEFCESRRKNWSKGWRPKKDWDNSQKPKKATEPKKPTDMTWHEVKWLCNIFSIYNIEYSNKLNNTIQEYNKTRKKKLSKLTERWLNMFVKKLVELGKDEDGIVAVLDQSIMNWWEWIFEVKSKNKIRTPSNDLEWMQEFEKLSDNRWESFKLKYWKDKYLEIKKMYKAHKQEQLLNKI